VIFYGKKGKKNVSGNFDLFSPQKFRKPGKFEGTEMSGNIESTDTVVVTE
jgi:hypothetical protein